MHFAAKQGSEAEPNDVIGHSMYLGISEEQQQQQQQKWWNRKLHL